MKLDRVIALRNDRTVYRDGERCVKVFAPGYPRAAVLGEAMNAALAAEAGLAVPPVREVSMGERPTLVTDFISGRPLDDLDALVALQLRVQATPAAGFARLGDVLRPRLSEASRAAFDALPAGDALCHCDLTPENLLCTPSGEVVILDWADAVRGPATADAALTYARLRHARDVRADGYLARYVAVSGVAREEIEAWLPILAEAYGLL